MNGKELKVTELELKFGQKPRLVNVFGVFRYRPNNGLYVIYADVGTTYDYVCYGASHIKNDSILSMNSNKAEDIEVIKEYIYKVTNGESLDNFEIMPLDNINEIEIISSKNFEIKKEILAILINKTIPPKIETPENTVNQELEKQTPKKKSPIISILLVLLIIIIAGAGYLFVVVKNENSKVSKSIYCTKTYKHEELESVTVEEEKTFQFNNYDKLEKLRIINRFKFSDENIYLDFVNKASYYKYMPEDTKNTIGGYKLDNENQVFVTTADINVDNSYQDPINYEEVLSVNTKNKYNCEEKIEK